MNFTLEINKNFEKMLKTATDLYIQVNAYIEKKECSEECTTKIMENTSDDIAQIIVDLGNVIGTDIATQAFDEDRRINTNYKNTDSHVSK
ncbi:MAG: hypothetical protein LKI39_00955 [Bacteroides sp.]|jgi:hypothetical protein|nr:hypothetical protein [Bacteroides sp.]